MKDDKKEEVYYVGLDHATEFRREVLETAKAVVETISHHGRIRDIQDDKLKLRTQLAHIVYQIKEDLHSLEVKLPKRDVQVSAPAPVISVASKKRPLGDHRLDKIESALQEIESRMRSL
jgi:hypothetical protein